MIHFDCLGNHRGDNREEGSGALIVAIGLVGKIYTQGPDRLTVNQNWKTNESQFLPAERQLSNTQSIEEHWLATDLRYHDRLACLDHPAGDPLADAIFDPAHTTFV